MIRADWFVPCTREIAIGRAGVVVYRPIRSWHSGVFAGERLKIVGGDRSGCIEEIAGRKYAQPPYSYTHRVYWHKRKPEKTISAFLSYPNGMGCCPEYFWEAYVGDEPERFTGPKAEAQMETKIVRALVFGALAKGGRT